MAVSKRDLEILLRPNQNDNLPRALARASARPQLVARSFGADLDLDLPHLRTRFEGETGILWAVMKHAERACYTPGLMQDMRSLQLHLRHLFAGMDDAAMPVRWLVWASDAPRAWSLGGDLATFTTLIRERNEQGLRAYAHLAIDILHDNLVGMDLPVLTMAMIQGDAVGGGFEAMLTDDVVVAERSARFGLPEILFQLFPGMGGYSFLRRKLDASRARMLIEDGVTRTADEMQALGLVDVVTETGGAQAALREWLGRNDPRFRTLLTLKRVRQRVDPVTKRELLDVVDLWVDLAMGTEGDALRRMDCLARVQERRRVDG